MFEYTNGRFIAADRILGASIYTKNNEIRVAIDLDVKHTDKNAVYTQAFSDAAAANNFIKTIPVNREK